MLVENNTLTFYPFVGKGLDAQPIIRQFTDPVTPERPEDTLTLPAKSGCLSMVLRFRTIKEEIKSLLVLSLKLLPLLVDLVMM